MKDILENRHKKLKRSYQENKKLEHQRSKGFRKNCFKYKGVSRTPTSYKMEFFVTLLNGFQQLTNVTKNSISDVAIVQDPSLKLL